MTLSYSPLMGRAGEWGGKDEGGIMFEEIKEGLKKAGVRFDELRSFL